MKFALTALALFLVSTPALAIDIDFSGSISMGVVGTSSAGAGGLSPFVGVDSEATVSFDLGDGGLTVGVVIPLNAEIVVDDSFLPGHR